jgi:hypothetical protein
MEILAVTKALANIPDGMHVWIMTDSAYVKNGVTQSVGNWQRNGWKNSGGARVANKSLWERLIAAVNRMRRVEWSWVKAHNGRLLNECVDMLATRAVFNEQRPCPIETVRVVGEDSDHTVYESLDGEETLVVGKDGDAYPLGRTYVLKAGPEVTRPFSVGPSSTSGPVDAEEQAIEACLKETLALCTRDVHEPASVPDSVGQDDDEAFPIPEGSSSQGGSPDGIRWESTDHMMQRIARQIKFMADRVEWESWTRPDWWSPAWEGLADVRDGNWKRIVLGSPLELKDNITEDVYVTDDMNLEYEVDSGTGERVDYRSNPELINVASGIVWNAQGSTMLRKCDKGADPNDLMLSLFEWAVKLVPAGCNMTYATHSDWLYEQWRDMMGWKEAGYQGLDQNPCPLQWKGIMQHVEQRISNVTVVKLDEMDIDPKIRNAATLYGNEGVTSYREFLATPDGAELPPTAPWS